jgi:hypothetical protein
MNVIHCRRLVAALGILGLIAVFAPVGDARAADGYFSALPDLPLMTGLAEDLAATVMFDKPEGRIVKMTATGRVSRTAVMNYYARALPQLGWEIVRSGRFRREGEILLINISGTGNDLTVRFSLLPE